MKTFALQIRDAEQTWRCETVESFVGSDAGGSFGLLAGAETTVASLAYGLARFRPAGGPWHYAALPSGVLWFDGRELTITATRFRVDTRRDAMEEALAQDIADREREIAGTRRTISGIEHALMRKLLELGRGFPGGESGA